MKELIIREKTAGFLFALFSAVSFSTLGLFAKSLFGAGIAVEAVLSWRFIIAATFLWIMVAARTQNHRQALQFFKIRKLVILGLLGFAPQAGLFFLTVKILDPGITSLLLYLYPAFVFIIGALFRGEKAHRAQVAALILSLGGSMLTFWNAGNYPAYGIILGMTVAAAYAIYLVLSERILEGTDPIIATAIIITVAAAVYVVIAMIKGTLVILSWPRQVLLAGGVGIMATVLPIITLFMAMQRIGARDTSIISTIEPVCTNILSMMLFNEVLTGRRIAGGILILAGVALLQRADYASARGKDSLSLEMSRSGAISPSSKSKGTEEGNS
ncbi:MAG: DMT family transporter [Rectinema sp.]|nr:DMT family transporter [Rectinema sp.]